MNREIQRQVAQAVRKAELAPENFTPAEAVTAARNGLYSAACGVAECGEARAPLALLAYDIAVDNLAAAYRSLPT